MGAPLTFPLGSIPLYGGGFNAPSEYTAEIRGLMDQNGIPWQTHTYKVGVGGGGTIGEFMSREDMEVIDLGVPLLSMHSPFEMSSKVDVWDFYRTMSSFYHAMTRVGRSSSRQNTYPSPRVARKPSMPVLCRTLPAS
jgi:putative aminopeptidase FrvX